MGEAYVSFEIGFETDAFLWFGIVLEQRLKNLTKQIELLQQKIEILEEALVQLKAR